MVGAQIRTRVLQVLMKVCCFVFAVLLCGSSAAQKKSGTAEVLPLNHAFVVPDADTFEAALRDPFLRNELGAFEQRTTKRSDRIYTGLYWYGEHTYFELMQPNEKDPAGSSGIAFGTDGQETIAKLQSRPGSPKSQTITRGNSSDQQVDWFLQLETPVQMHASQLDTWVMQYFPDFLNKWYPQSPPADHSATREHVLERYAAKIGETKQRSSGLLQDVVAIDLRLADDDFANFNTLCGYAGMSVDLKGSTIICHGADLTITAISIATQPAPAIAKITFRLRHAKEGKQEYRIGSSAISFHGETADWTF